MYDLENFIAHNVGKELWFVIPGAIIEGKLTFWPQVVPGTLLLTEATIYWGLRQAFVNHVTLRLDHISAWSDDAPLASQGIDLHLE